MLFHYQAIDQAGKPQNGTINAGSNEIAISSLQRRGLTVLEIAAEEAAQAGVLSARLSLFSGVSTKDVVLLSRQIATLFEAQVSALRVFQLLAEQADKPALHEALVQITDDLQAGDNLSKALSKHPNVFSEFYVNMVRSGEESGKLDQTFLFLADYLDRSYTLTSKVRNALIYPSFILVTFVVVMIFMLAFVIPKISDVLLESGSDIPIYTQIVVGFSNFLVDYGIFLLIGLIVGGFFFVRWARTESGRREVDALKVAVPLIGDLYRKLYLTRIADNMHAMLSSGISAVRALEITSSVVDNQIYEDILTEAVGAVKSGSPMSAALAHHRTEMPPVLIQMIQIGEETGELGTILERLARFYQREVDSAVDTLVSLIEPALIVLLALGVGFLLASVLLPIYNIAGTF